MPSFHHSVAVLPLPLRKFRKQARSQDFCKGGGHDDEGTEGPERGAEARSAEWGGVWKFSINLH